MKHSIVLSVWFGKLQFRTVCFTDVLEFYVLIMSSRGRGRSSYNSEKFVETIVPFIDRIFIDKNVNKIVSKSNRNWQEIALCYEGLTPASLYTMLTGNRHDIKHHTKIAWKIHEKNIEDQTS